MNGLLHGKCLKKLVITNDEIFLYDKGFHKVAFIANEKHIFAVNIDKINLVNDNNFMKMILILLFLSHFWLDVLNWKNEQF